MERKSDLSQFMEAPVKGSFQFIDNPPLTIAQCKQYNGLVVFGDNTERWGKGGLAVIRDAPNALGVVTKWRPKRNPSAYFHDDQDKAWHALAFDMERVLSFLDSGTNVFWPEGRIGTGLAFLPEKAPALYSYMVNYTLNLARLYP